MKCNRTVCQYELDSPHDMRDRLKVILIWNQGTDIPRVYCLVCGRKIIGYNKHDDMKLVWEMVTVTDAEYRFPSLFKELK